MFKKYRKAAIAEMEPWTLGADMDGVSVSDEDKVNGSPKIGDMISRNPKNHADRWLVAAEYFEENYVEVTE